jgi:hypothetical protein
MPKDTDILNTLTSFFYDLAKEVPIGQLNRVLMQTVISEDNQTPMDLRYCDEDLRSWAEKFAVQLIDYRTKFTKVQLHTMGMHKTVSREE